MIYHEYIDSSSRPAASSSPRCGLHHAEEDPAVDGCFPGSYPVPGSGSLASGDMVRLFAVRMKNVTMAVVAGLEAEGKDKDINPIRHPIPAQIRASVDENLFLAADRSWTRPVMETKDVQRQDKYVFMWGNWFSADFGKLCTFLHQPSGKYLAVDLDTKEVVLHSCPRAPLCVSVSSRHRWTSTGTRPCEGPVPQDDLDCQPHPSCFFCIPPKGLATRLGPVLCEDMSLSYGDGETRRVCLVAKQRGKDFMMMPPPP